MNIVILWHMHQPYYVNPLTRKAKMPWVRLHAAKGYLDMIDLVTANPDVRVTFNFTPVLIRQINELVRGEVEDEWETLSRKPAANLDEMDRRLLVENFFKINWETLVRPMPRYAELLSKRGASYTSAKVDSIARAFTDADFRDLQLLYNLQWCGFSAFRRHPVLSEIKARGRDFTEQDKTTVLDIHREILGMVLGEYRAAQDRGQIELTTTPYFHPIMPLVYDTNIARRCQPNSPLPSPFSAPDDVRAHLRLAQELHEQAFGRRARGLWPSEGSIAPEIIPLMVEAGIEYFGSDEGNLFRSLKHDLAWMNKPVDHLELFQGWRIHAGGATIQALFRDRPLSDFIGFDAARNETSRAVEHMVENLKNIAKAVPGARAVTPLILDGENAWEAFPDGGEAFLTSFYQGLTRTPDLRTRRMGDYFDEFPAQAETSYLHSGSWIRSDYDIWIGDPEENKAWEWLGETRAFLVERQKRGDLAPDVIEKAWWEIYAAEGSDWFWWYGPDFTIDTDLLFDELFRTHLQNVYRLVGVEPPAHLEVPICLPSSALAYSRPLNLITPELSDDNEHFFDWLGAGELDLTRQATAMFQGDRIGQKLIFGFGPDDFYLRLDLTRAPESIILRVLLPQPARITLRHGANGATPETVVESSADGVNFAPVEPEGFQVHWGARSLRLALPRRLLGLEQAGEFAFFLQLLEGGLQSERFPERGAIELAVPGADFEPEQWFV
jgi:alpha-amylase/alpha-mannosidase (GH57 family)